MKKQRNIFDWACLISLICFFLMIFAFVGFVISEDVLGFFQPYPLILFANCVVFVMAVCIFILWIESWVYFFEYQNERTSGKNLSLFLWTAIGIPIMTYYLHFVRAKRKKEEEEYGEKFPELYTGKTSQQKNPYTLAAFTACSLAVLFAILIVAIKIPIDRRFYERPELKAVTEYIANSAELRELSDKWILRRNEATLTTLADGRVKGEYSFRSESKKVFLWVEWESKDGKITLNVFSDSKAERNVPVIENRVIQERWEGRE